MGPDLQRRGWRGKGRVHQIGDRLAHRAAVAVAILNRKAPRGGRLSTGCGSSPWHLGAGPIGCLWFTHRLSGDWQERKGITSLGRDARGLTFSAVIPAQVMQPGIATRGKHKWRMALCDYGMAFAPHHRVHVGFVAFRAHLRSGTGSGDPWPDSLGGKGPGWLPGLPSTSS
jgi:hypothetical protein